MTSLLRWDILIQEFLVASIMNGFSRGFSGKFLSLTKFIEKCDGFKLLDYELLTSSVTFFATKQLLSCCANANGSR